MTVFFSALSAYQYHSLQGLITFLALLSTAIWVSVLFVTLLRFVVQAAYRHKTKRFQKGRS